MTDELHPAYQLGHDAAQHPGNRGRAFAEIEEELQKGWTDEHRRRHGEWASVRGFAARAYGDRADTPGSPPREQGVRRDQERLDGI